MKRFSCLLLALALTAWGESKPKASLHPANFAFTRAIETSGGSALYRIDLTEDIYLGVVYDDLRDMRVFNGEGQVVPSSFQLKASEAAHQTEVKPISFFPILGESDKQYEGESTVQIQQGGQNQSVVVRFGGAAKSGKAVTRGYLFDLRQAKLPLRRLELDWEGAKDNSFYSVRLQGSDDLTNWRSLSAPTNLARFRFGGESLEQNSLDLDDTNAKYLLLTWTGGPNFALKGIKGEFSKNAWVEAKRHSTSVATRNGENGEYFFEKPALTADRLQVSLAVRNTMLRVEVDSRRDEKASWATRGQGLVYLVQTVNGDLASPSLKIWATNDRYWRLRLLGKDASLGKTNPKVEFGWIAHQLFFLAQGNAPFTLAYGQKEVEAPDFGFQNIGDTLGGESDQVKPALATLGPELKQAAVSVSPVAPSTEETSNEKKKYLLWASLATALLITSAMAWKLMRDLGKAKG